MKNSKDNFMKNIFPLSRFLHFCSLALFVLSMTACENFGSKIEELKKENDKLNKDIGSVEDNAKIMRGEYAEAIEVLNAIDDTLKSISDRDKQIQNLNKEMELSKDKSQKEEILSRLNDLKEANINAQQQTRALQAMLQKYKGENESLRKMIDQAETRVKVIDEELGSKRNMIGEMKATIKKTEKELAENQSELSVAYEDLKAKNEKLEATNKKLEKSIAELKKKNEFIGKEAWAYVCCGSKKFLRQKNILSSTSIKLTKGFQSSAQANGSRLNYFENKTISCSGKPISHVLPERDPGSYQIDGNKVIIRNSQNFWKTDKIVVLVQD
jgi:septal ring factor EnvC (AmiA/AmiB activator)